MIETPAYRAGRNRNNEAARKSRLKAKAERRTLAFVLKHPDLTATEQDSARRFLNGQSVPLTAATREVLRKHIVALRSHLRAYYAELLKRLDAS